MGSDTTISRYLIEQLVAHGVRHVFGVPGDYSLAFIEQLAGSTGRGEGSQGSQGRGLEFINTCDEQGAGYAADAYARMNGLGAVCITYAVGSLKVANTTAQAFAERSPVVVICGAPGVVERGRHPLLHHRVNDYDTQLKVFGQLTVDAAMLIDPQDAAAQIDRALHAAERHKRPVYLELPRDRVHSPISPGHRHVDGPVGSDPAALAEAVAEAVDMINAARQPVILAGEEIKRFDLDVRLVELAQAANIPVAASFLGKSVVREDLPLFIGVYAGAVSPPQLTNYVDSSDCCLLLGAMLTDLNLGLFTANLDRSRMICANIDGVAIGYHTYDVRLADFIDRLLAAGITRHQPTNLPRPPQPTPFVAAPGRTITADRLFQAVNAFLSPEMVVLADVGDALFGGVDLQILQPGHFISAAYYSDMGFAVPGAIGVQIQDRSHRPVVLVGDGAFQMTGMELSGAVRYGLSPIVIVMNNGGYATERFFLDGAFNDLQPWNFARVPDLVGGGLGLTVGTEDELDAALGEARRNTASFTIIDVRLGRSDVSAGLKRLGASLGKHTRG